eukprot:NODE_473_length_8033_cov_0.435216.p1 type:complete len:1055 gc:universal NODE_473_length_8033_cov_0.435216:2447-5611(+)
MSDNIHEKLKIQPEFAININLNVNTPVYLVDNTILFATSTFLVEMSMQGIQKIHDFHCQISNFVISSDHNVLAIHSQSESKVVFFDAKTMRKRRLLKDDQGILCCQFVNAKRFAILTEKHHLRVYAWEKGALELECNASCGLNPKLCYFDNSLVLCDKTSTSSYSISEKSIEQSKIRDLSVIQSYFNVLLCQNQILVNNFSPTVIDPSVDLITCNGVAVFKDTMIISYLNSLLLLEKSKNVYLPLKEYSFPCNYGNISGISHHRHIVLCYTTCGGIYEFSHLLDEENRYVCILQPTFNNKVISSTSCSRKPWIFYSLSDKTVCLFNYLSHKILFKKQFLESSLSLSIHPSSLYLLVSFPEKVTIYEILHNDLVVYKDINIRWCNNVKFSSGGHMFALTINNIIQLFDFWNVLPIMTFKGHSTNVLEIQFDYRDMYMYSTGTDGSLYSWNLLTNKRDSDHVCKGGVPIETVWINESTCVILQNDRTLKEVCNNSVVNQINLTVPCTCISYIKIAACVAVQGNDGRTYIYKYPFTLSQVPLIILGGHMASINGCEMVYNYGKFVTIDDDNYIVIWGLQHIEYVEPQFTDEIVVTKEEMDNQYQKLERLKIKTEEKKMEIQYQLQVKKSIIDKKLIDTSRQFEKETEIMNYEHDMEIKGYLDEEMRIKKQIQTEEEKFNKEKLEIESHYQQLLLFEYDKQQSLRNKLQNLKDKFESDLLQQDKELREVNNSRIVEHNKQETELKTKCDEDEKLLSQLEMKLRISSKLQEEEMEQELLEMKIDYDDKNKLLQEERYKIQAEHTQILGICEQLEKDIQLQNQEINKFEKEEADNINELKSLELILSKKQSELKGIELEINSKDDKINELRRKQEELEKYRFVMDYKLKELQDQVDPKRLEIEELNCLISKSKLQDANQIQACSLLNLKLQEITCKIELEKKNIEVEMEKHRRLQLFEKRMLYKFKQITKLTNKKDIKLKMHELNTEFEQLDYLSLTLLNENEQQVLLKQRDSLQKQIYMVQERIDKQEKRHQKQMSKLLKENFVLFEQVQDQQIQANKS